VQITGANLHTQPAFQADNLSDDCNSFELLLRQLRLRVARPVSTALRIFGSPIGHLCAKMASTSCKDPSKVVAGMVSIGKHQLPAIGFLAESVARACMELVCSQNRGLTLGMRVGRELLLTLQEQQSSRWKQQPECACEPHVCLHPWASQEGGGTDILQDARLSKSLQKSTSCLRSVMWTLKEAVLLMWLENIGGICRVRAPAPLLRGSHNAGRAVLGRAMRLWGQGVAQRVIHGPLRSRSRLGLGRISKISCVLSSACVGAGIGASAAAHLGASQPDAALCATAVAALFCAATVDAVSTQKAAAHTSEEGAGLVGSGADANGLLLGTSYLGLWLVGGRYSIGTGGVHLSGSFCNGVDEDGFENPYPSAVFGRTHENDMTMAHMLACIPFTMADCLLGVMGFMPASLRKAMSDERVQKRASAVSVMGALQAHSLGTLEARLLKANMAWAGDMVLFSPPPPFGWEEGTRRECGRFDPICSGPLMSVAKHLLAAPVSYTMRDLSHARHGLVHAKPLYTRHCALAGVDGMC